MADITIAETPYVLRGVHLLKDHCMAYPPAIEPTDVLEIDFDQKSIGPDGIYAITYPAVPDNQTAFGCAWSGVRRFCHSPIRGLQIFEGDEWRPINAGHRDMQVVGRVVNVYRRTNV